MAKFRKKPIEGQRFRCKCGKIVIIDEKRRTTYHETPLCKYYEAALREIGGNQPGGIVTEPKEDG